MTSEGPSSIAANSLSDSDVTVTDLGSIWIIGTALFIGVNGRSEEHTSELQSQEVLVCRLLLEKKLL